MSSFARIASTARQIIIRGCVWFHGPLLWTLLLAGCQWGNAQNIDIKGHARGKLDTTPSKLPADLMQKCDPPPGGYTAVKPPDRVAELLNDRELYRLVIAADQFKVSPEMNRSFVAQSAALIDQSLARLGYKPLPSLATRLHPYLSGSTATKAEIKAALREMVRVTGRRDLGVIYYLGHGILAPSHRDLSLAVYDRPVAEDDGIRVSDILGILTYDEWRSDVNQIPHFLIILETCYSGFATAGSTDTLRSLGDQQLLETLQGILVVPKEIALLSATSTAADSTRAYELKGTGLSAFGFFFAQATGADWQCADSTTPDGILTLEELVQYLRAKLTLAKTLNLIEGRMEPVILSKNQYYFIAYSPKYHSIDGVRKQIIELVLKPDSGLTARVITPNGNTYTCGKYSPTECSVLISADMVGALQVSSFLTLEGRGGSFPGMQGDIGKVSNTLELSQLLETRHAVVARVTVDVK